MRHVSVPNKLNNVLHVPDLAHNIISVPQLVAQEMGLSPDEPNPLCCAPISLLSPNAQQNAITHPLNAALSNVSPCAYISRDVATEHGFEVTKLRRTSSGMDPFQAIVAGKSNKKQYYIVREIVFEWKRKQPTTQQRAVVQFHIGPVLVLDAAPWPMVLSVNELICKTFFKEFAFQANPKAWLKDGSELEIVLDRFPVGFHGTVSLFPFPDDVVLDECARCGIRFPQLQKCSQCKQVLYCTKACQRQHWKDGHKQECVSNSTKTSGKK